MSTVFMVAPDGTVTIAPRFPKVAPGTAARKKMQPKSIRDTDAEYSDEPTGLAGHKWRAPRDPGSPCDKYIRVRQDPRLSWYFDGYPTKPGVHSYVLENNMGFVNKALRQFLEAMNRRPGFKVISTNITPFFNGVNCTVIYSIDDYDIFTM